MPGMLLVLDTRLRLCSRGEEKKDLSVYREAIRMDKAAELFRSRRVVRFDGPTLMFTDKVFLNHYYQCTRSRDRAQGWSTR